LTVRVQTDIAAIQPIRSVLAMFDPITLSTAKLVFQSSADKSEVASSGILPPIATIVAPTIKLLIPKYNPKFSAQSVK